MIGFWKIFSFINLLGIVAFSISGSLKAIKEGLDLLGITVLAITTALGGGILRDVIINTVPIAFKSKENMIFAILGLLIGISIYKFEGIENSMLILIPDAIGLSAFSATGAMVAYNTNVNIFGIVILATLTGVGGGVISDILLGKIPSVLKDDFYASCSIIGAILFYITITISSNITFSAIACVISVFIVRILAIMLNWRLPRFK
ncbi:trimeric intracellular cation channel family protein [Hydrogenobaculum acidophilum]